MEQQATTMYPYSATVSPTLEVTNKVCTKCGRTLPLSSFSRNARNRDGIQNWCKDCQHEANKHRRESMRKAAVHQSDGRNPELAKFKPVQLIEELRSRGYRGPSLTPTKSPSNVTTMEKSEYCETQSRITSKKQ